PEAEISGIGENRVRFKIRDMCSSSYYRGPRWSRKEFVLKKRAKNIAQMMPSTSPFLYPDYDNIWGNDGNFKTNWASNTTEKNPWYQVDLEWPFRLQAVKLIDRTENWATSRTDFALQVSNDPEFKTFTELARKEGEPYPLMENWVCNVSDNNAYRYVRLQRLNDAGLFTFAELEVYGADTETRPEDLAFKKPCKASTVFQGNGAVNAVDGNTGTIWANAKGGVDLNPYWQVDLEKASRIGKIEFIPYWNNGAEAKGSRTNFEIWASNTEDFTEHTVLGEKTGEAFPYWIHWFLDITDTTKYRYVRMQGINNNPLLIIAEARVYAWKDTTATVVAVKPKLSKGGFRMNLDNTGHLLTVNGLENFTFIDLYDISGRQILSSEEKIIDVRGLKTGTYYVDVRGKAYIPEVFVKVK
ncbi:MAG: discoidin domain-containing protein, partial [Fibrobacteria bacterium]|nr:discoidin domain-containing protein [Fibrobacteria bacterium]